MREKRRTASAGVVGLDVGSLDLAVLDLERVPLPAHAAEDGVPVESQVQRLGELARRVP